MSLDSGIWVLVEHDGANLPRISSELLSEGRRIADKLGDELCAVVMGANVDKVVTTLALYTDKIYVLESPVLASYVPEFYTEALSDLFREQAPKIALFGATLMGKDLAPRLAARLKTSLVSDCVALKLDKEGLLLLTKPTYGGRVYTTFVCPAARPQLASLRPGTVEIDLVSTKMSEVIRITPQLAEVKPCIKSIGFIKGDPKTISLEEAEIIVAGGRGVGSASNFQLLEELAEVLGASVGASRVAVDAGWVSSEKMIGQSGKAVAPRLYIACGISGASHHIFGMKNSDIVIAINTDSHAPIFKLADVEIVGNLLEIVPAITHQLRELSKASSRG